MADFERALLQCASDTTDQAHGLLPNVSICERTKEEQHGAVVMLANIRENASLKDGLGLGVLMLAIAAFQLWGALLGA